MTWWWRGGSVGGRSGSTWLDVPMVLGILLLVRWSYRLVGCCCRDDGCSSIFWLSEMDVLLGHKSTPTTDTDHTAYDTQKDRHPYGPEPPVVVYVVVVTTSVRPVGTAIGVIPIAPHRCAEVTQTIHIGLYETVSQHSGQNDQQRFCPRHGCFYFLQLVSERAVVYQTLLLNTEHMTWFSPRD